MSSQPQVEHPAACAPCERLPLAIRAVTSHGAFSLGIMPDRWLIEGDPARDMVRLTFAGAVPAEAVARLLGVLTKDSRALREAGGL